MVSKKGGNVQVLKPSSAWFERLVVETRHALARYLRQFSQSPDDIQDIVQETYLKVFCALRNAPERRESPEGLIYTTARNIAISRLRHQQVVTRAATAITVSEELRTDAKTLEQQTGRSEKLRELMRVVNTLPPKCRAVFVLRMIDGLSQREIGERLGISTSTVEKHLAKGLRHCKAELLAARTEVAGEATPVRVAGRASA